MKRIAVMFPGQGSQHPGMGRALYEIPECRNIFDRTDEELGYSLSKTCFEGSKERLRLTEITQPGILAVSVAAWKLLEKDGFFPDFVMGHSLGEYSALVANGCLRFRDAVSLVEKRGKFMQEAVAPGAGAMYAVLGLDFEKVSEACAEVRRSGGVVSPANDNAPDQVVIAGEKDAVEEAAALASQRGAKRVVPLQVSAPFHSELMKPAQDKLAPFLHRTDFSGFQCPLVNNVDAKVVTRPEDAREGLIRQVASPVRWRSSVELLLEEKVETVIEVGPGKVLSGIAKRMWQDWTVLNFEDPEGYEIVRRELEDKN